MHNALQLFNSASEQATGNIPVNADVCASVLETILWLDGKGAQLIPHGNGLLAVQGSRNTDKEAAENIINFFETCQKYGRIGSTPVTIKFNAFESASEHLPTLRICNNGKWICGLNTPEIAVGLTELLTKRAPYPMRNAGDPQGDLAVANFYLMETRLLQEGLFSLDSEISIKNKSRINAIDPESESVKKIITFMSSLYRRYNEETDGPLISFLDKGKFEGDGLFNPALTTFLAKDIAAAARNPQTPSNQSAPILPTRAFPYRKIVNSPCAECASVR